MGIELFARDCNYLSPFICFDDDWPLSIVNADSETKYLERAPMHRLVLDTDLTGFPNAFEFSTGQLHLFPLPDAVYTINLPHYARSTALSSATTSPWFTEFPALVIEETALLIARSNRDKSLAQTSNAGELRGTYFRRVEAMKHQLMSYQMGD